MTPLFYRAQSFCITQTLVESQSHQSRHRPSIRIELCMNRTPTKVELCMNRSPTKASPHCMNRTLQESKSQPYCQKRNGVTDPTFFSEIWVQTNPYIQKKNGVTDPTFFLKIWVQTNPYFQKKKGVTDPTFFLKIWVQANPYFQKESRPTQKTMKPKTQKAIEPQDVETTLTPTLASLLKQNISVFNENVENANGRPPASQAKPRGDLFKTQISRTRAESQQIVAQRPLSCVQYPVPYLSRIRRICCSRYLNLFFSIA